MRVRHLIKSISFFKRKRKTVVAMTMVIMYLSSFFWSPTSIVDFYNSENDNGSYIVTMNMAPKNMAGAIHFWLENKKEILNKTNELNNGKYILFVSNKFEDKIDEGDGKLCFLKQIKNNGKCLNYSSRIFNVTRRQKNGLGFYSLNQEDAYLTTEKSCLFFDYDNGQQDYLGCDL